MGTPSPKYTAEFCAAFRYRPTRRDDVVGGRLFGGPQSGIIPQVAEEILPQDKLGVIEFLIHQAVHAADIIVIAAGVN